MTTTDYSDAITSEARAAMEGDIKRYLDTNANALLCVSRKNMARQIVDLVIAYHWPSDPLPNDDDRRVR